MILGGQSALATEIDLHHWQISDPGLIRFGTVTLSLSQPPQVFPGRLSLNGPKSNAGPQTDGRFTPPVRGNYFLISSLENASRNALGGRMGVFQKKPSVGTLEPAVDQGLNALRFDNHLNAPGFVGMWIQLKNTSDPQHVQYLDARTLGYLSFWVKGSGNYMLKLADKKWDLKEDALSVAPLETYLPRKSLDDQWQLAMIPLADLPDSLDLSQLANLVIQSSDPGKHQLLLRNLTLSVSPFPLPDLKPGLVSNTQHPTKRGVWLWNTEKLVKKPARVPPKIRFLKNKGVTDVYLQLYASENSPIPGLVAFDSQVLIPIIAAFHQAGMRVHALDGDKRYALPENHAGVLATLKRIVSHNSSFPEAAFDGVHYDIEPYLLPGYFGQRYDKINGHLLNLISQMSVTLKQAQLPFGMAIPPWLDGKDEFTGKPFTYTFQGLTHSINEHIQRLTDEVVIMDYRTRVKGAGGIVQSVADELAFAKSLGKSVVVGLETMDLPNEITYSFEGPPLKKAPVAYPYLALIQEKGKTHMRIVREGLPTWAGNIWYWPLKQHSMTMGKELSFAQHGSKALEQAMTESSQMLSASSAFGGLALHFVESLETLYGSP